MSRRLARKRQAKRMKLVEKHLGKVVNDDEGQWFVLNGNGVAAPDHMPRYMVLQLFKDYDPYECLDAAFTNTLKEAAHVASESMLGLTGTDCLRVYDLDTGLFRYPEKVKIEKFCRPIKDAI